MSAEGIFCSGCGITLRPFMKACPRCGTVREDATPIETPQSSSEISSEPDRASSASAVTQPQTEVVPLNAIRLQHLSREKSGFAPQLDTVILPPGETSRRFPIFTSAQWTLVAIGIGLLVLMLVIAYLLWRQQKRETFPVGDNSAVTALPSPSVAVSPDPGSTPLPLAVIDDQKINEGVKSALMAYNPLGFARYKFEVKDGIVTLNGEAEHQPEKDGADNVIRLIAGVKSVVNNLKVKPEEPFLPLKVNAAEAKLLDEALKRQIQADERAKSDPQKQPQPDSQREAERQRREAAAARQREEEIALRKAAEEKLRREGEEFEKRQEEFRRIEADRRARAEQAKIEAGVLRSGTVAWSGFVEGVDEIIFTGSSSSVRHVSGNPPREVRASFSAPIPRSPVTVNLISTNGRGTIQIAQQPSSVNGYTTIVRIDDSGKGGDKRYEFTLRWTVQ